MNYARAMNNAQAAYDGQEAPEYYAEDYDEAFAQKQREEWEAEQEAVREDRDA